MQHKVNRLLTKKCVDQVVKQCCATDGVEPQYIKDEILPPFFKHFWNQRMALDRRNYRQVSPHSDESSSVVRSLPVNHTVVADTKLCLLYSRSNRKGNKICLLGVMSLTGMMTIMNGVMKRVVIVPQ